MGAPAPCSFWRLRSGPATGRARASLFPLLPRDGDRPTPPGRSAAAVPSAGRTVPIRLSVKIGTTAPPVQRFLTGADGLTEEGRAGSVSDRRRFPPVADAPGSPLQPRQSTSTAKAA